MFLENQLREMDCKWKIKFLTIILVGITITKGELTYLLSSCSAIRPSKSHGRINYGHLFFPVDSFPLPSLYPHFQQILLHIFKPSISRSSFLLIPIVLLSNIFYVSLLDPFLLHIKFSLVSFFNICFYVWIIMYLLQLLISSYSPYSLLYHRSM